MTDPESMTFQEEIDNDISKTAQMLRRSAMSDISDKERKTIEIFKRVLTVIDEGGVSVSNGPEVVSGHNNFLPVASYLAHGSRTLIQIPPIAEGEDPHQFFNWVIHGNKSVPFIEENDTGNPLFKRSVSSHSTHLESIDGDWCFVEDKGVMVGALDTMTTFTKRSDQSHHFGLNFAFEVDKLGQDSNGKSVSGPDGEHGHMYFHYRPPSHLYPGSLMIGIENSEPGKSNHSLLGTPNKSTHIGGSKWSKLEAKYKKSKDSQESQCVIPATLNGMRVDLSQDSMHRIISNKECFDIKCLTRPPKQPANTRRQLLVNKHLKREKKIITLVELMSHTSTEEIDLSCYARSSRRGNYKER